jgi:hypothetical protein
LSPVDFGRDGATVIEEKEAEPAANGAIVLKVARDDGGKVGEEGEFGAEDDADEAVEEEEANDEREGKVVVCVSFKRFEADFTS